MCGVREVYECTSVRVCVVSVVVCVCVRGCVRVSGGRAEKGGRKVCEEGGVGRIVTVAHKKCAVRHAKLLCRAKEAVAS